MRLCIYGASDSQLLWQRCTDGLHLPPMAGVYALAACGCTMPLRCACCTIKTKKAHPVCLASLHTLSTVARAWLTGLGPPPAAPPLIPAPAPSRTPLNSSASEFCWACRCAGRVPWRHHPRLPRHHPHRGRDRRPALAGRGGAAPGRGGGRGWGFLAGFKASALQSLLYEGLLPLCKVQLQYNQWAGAAACSWLDGHVGLGGLLGLSGPAPVPMRNPGTRDEEATTLPPMSPQKQCFVRGSGAGHAWGGAAVGIGCFSRQSLLCMWQARAEALRLASPQRGTCARCQGACIRGKQYYVFLGWPPTLRLEGLTLTHAPYPHPHDRAERGIDAQLGPPATTQALSLHSYLSWAGPEVLAIALRPNVAKPLMRAHHPR